MFELFGGGGFVFAFRVLPTLIFFCLYLSTLLHRGNAVGDQTLGGALQKTLGTSRAESMSAAAIFSLVKLRHSVVRPFVPKMTQSELFAVMCGLASIAGVLAAFAGMGVKMEYLVAASFMAALVVYYSPKLSCQKQKNQMKLSTLILMAVMTNQRA